MGHEQTNRQALSGALHRRYATCHTSNVHHALCGDDIPFIVFIQLS